jgi:hypothetical protein
MLRAADHDPDRAVAIVVIALAAGWAWPRIFAALVALLAWSDIRNLDPPMNI